MSDLLTPAPAEIPELNDDLYIIQKLDDQPNDVGGLTAEELKLKFDEGINRIKTYINGTLIPALFETIAVEQAREAAEQERVSNEEGRAAAESERQVAELNRAAAEDLRDLDEEARAAAEAARATEELGREQAEAARVLAEAARDLWESWDGATAYAPGNKVSKGGQSWLCLSPNTGRDPEQDGGAYWLLIAGKGEKGDRGDDALVNGRNQVNLVAGDNVRIDEDEDKLIISSVGGYLILDRLEIAAPPSKTVYNALEQFDPAGMVVVASYTNKAITARVTGYTVEPSGPMQAGTTEVTITYTEGGETRSVTQAVTVNKLTLAVPSQAGTLEYNRYPQTPAWSGFDSSLMRKDEAAGTEAGSYSTTISLLDKDNCQWNDGTTTDKTVDWSIAVKVLEIPVVSNTSLSFDGTARGPDVTGFDGDYMELGGTSAAVNVGSYTLTIRLMNTASTKWSDGTTADKSTDWSITRISVTVPTQDGTLTYTGNAQSPAWSGYDQTRMTISGATAATDAGSYNAVFTLGANYQWNDGTTAPKTVAWTIGKAAGSLSVSTTSVAMTSESPSATVAVTRAGDGAISAASSDTAVCTVSVSGTIATITGVGSGSATVTISVADGTNYLAPEDAAIGVTADLVNIYGVQWDGSGTTKWTRTDAAASFTDPVPATSASGSGSSPFDTLQPWAGMTKSERTGGTMVSIPKFWYKITGVGSGMKIQIADKAQPGYSVSPAHMDRGDGGGERDVVYAARYHSAESTYKSATGVKPQVNQTRATFRTNIHNIGNKIWQTDWPIRATLWLLIMVEFADWNTQATIGGGCSQTTAPSSGVFNNGATDSMVYHTGNVQGSHSAYGACQYRWIEGLWDNCRDWMDGCYYDSNGLNVILNPSNFADGDSQRGGTLVGSCSSGYPSAFAVRTGGFPCFTPTAAGGSDSSYSCDSWGFNASNPCLFVGGGYYQSGSYGLFYVYCSSASYSGGDIGARLQELP